MLGLFAVNIDFVLSVLSTLSVFCAIAAVSWPYMGRDPLAARMQLVAGEREAMRRREREQLNPSRRASRLRPQPKKIYSRIVDWLKLDMAGPGSKTAKRLRMAGYRGGAALTTFAAAQVILPVAAFGLAFFYVVVVLRLPLQLWQALAVSAVMGGITFFVPSIFVTNRITKRKQAIQRAWPDALDLMLICVESGMSIDAALIKVSEEIGVQSVEAAEELSLTSAELSFLQDRRQAYENLSERTGLDTVRAVVASLKQAEQHGTSLGRSLRVLSQENRDMRLSLAEKKAAALPPKLTVPMILFFLPVLFAVIITPAIIQISSTH